MFFRASALTMSCSVRLMEYSKLIRMRLLRERTSQKVQHLMRSLVKVAPVIPFIDLKAQYKQIKPEIDLAVHRVIESAQFVLGPEVAAFEKRFADYCGVTHCVAVNSGTSALHL